MLEHISCMKTLCNQLNKIEDTITNKKLACNLLASLPLDKYEVLITSVDVQDEDNLQFNRLKYLISQFSHHEASTRKDSDTNISNQM